MKWTKIFALLLPLGLLVSIWPVLHAQIKSGQKDSPLTLAQVLTGLQTQGTVRENRTLAARNQYIARRVRERGVTFPLTEAFESELRNAGASEELLKVIRAPTSKPTPKPVTPNPTLDFNKWREEAITRAQKVARLKQSRYEACEQLLERSKKGGVKTDDLAAKAKASVADNLAATKKYRDSLNGLVMALEERAQMETEATEKKRKLIAQGKMVERDLAPHKQELARINSQIEDTNKRIAQADQLIDEAMNREQLAKTSPFALDLAAIQKRFDPQISDAMTQYVAFLRDWSQRDATITNATSTLKPQIIYKEKAKYTEAARLIRVQGTLLISAVFTADGHVTDVHVIRGLPAGLDNEAIKAVSETVFLPALKDGKPVSFTMSITYSFNLS